MRSSKTKKSYSDTELTISNPEIREENWKCHPCQCWWGPGPGQELLFTSSHHEESRLDVRQGTVVCNYCAIIHCYPHIRSEGCKTGPWSISRPPLASSLHVTPSMMPSASVTFLFIWLSDNILFRQNSRNVLQLNLQYDHYKSLVTPASPDSWLRCWWSCYRPLSITERISIEGPGGSLSLPSHRHHELINWSVSYIPGWQMPALRISQWDSTH